MVRRWTLLAITLCGMFGAVLAWASALEQGAEAYRRGDFDAAARLWQPLAEQGDRDAQFALGTLYQLGRGVEQSDALATRWFRRAAERGSVPAQYNLGNAYKHGRGVEADDAQAFQWWIKAAESGLAPAQFNVGTAYLYGRGVSQSDEQGIAWYEKAAANGHGGAQAALERLGRPARSTLGVHASTWVRQRSPERYTLQLLAAENEAAARNFIASLPPGSYAICAYRSQSKRWFAVLSGDYPSAAAARQAARQWRLQTQPWVRKFQTLQAQLVE